MEYLRRMIYLKKYDHGLELSDRGFVRLEKREGELLLHLSVREIDIVSGSEVYLLYQQEGEIYSYMIASLGGNPMCDFRCALEYLPIELSRETVVGVYIGTPQCYLVGMSGDEEEISLEWISDAVMSREKKSTAKKGIEQERRQKGEPLLQKEQREKAHQQKEYQQRECKQRENRYAECVRDELKDRLQEMYPFEDDELEWCRQLVPEDLYSFPMEHWHLSKNSFLLQGFYNYRHLLYAHKEGKDFIGVPGQYHRREQYLAGNFGFSWFKGTRKKRVMIGDYGYWMRVLE